jgi:ribosomal protein L37AE/L43A
MYKCPYCGRLMTEEEGLYWCDECGINIDSYTYKQGIDKQERINQLYEQN